jgi:hypothetical protein
MKKMPSTSSYNPLSLRDAKPVLVRVGGALAIAMGFLWVTSQVDPGATRATETENGVLPIVASTKAPVTSLGTLEGRDYIINLVSTPDGPRYTVVDHFGAVLATGLTQEQVYEEFSDLTLDRMLSSPVMMVDTDFDN